jgi:Protein of unknown function (DUF732)
MNGFVVGSDGVAPDYDDWADTEFGPQFQQQAWSDGDPSVEPHPHTERHPWATAMAGAGIAVALGALIAAIVLLTTGASSDSTPTTPDANGMTTATAAPPPWTSPAETPPPPPPAGPFIAPTEIAMVETQDGDFLQRLIPAHLDPVASNGTGQQGVITWAHGICRLRGSGDSLHRLVLLYTDGLTWEQGYAAVNAAIAVYCPELG